MPHQPPHNTPFDLARIGAGLPVAAALQDFAEALAQHTAVVVQAPPGTGKTTLIPPALHNKIHPRKVLVTAPRRVVVRAAARRLRELDPAHAGSVGFSIRGQREPGDHVEFVTPGVLLRRLLRDPELSGVGAVIIDEVHERQLDTDLVLGMLAELRLLRDDFYLVLMSATLDAERYSALLDDAPIVTTPAVIHPVDVYYQPGPPRVGARGVEKPFLEHLARTAQRALTQHRESVLVFVPGVRDVEYVASLLDNATLLHGSLPPGAQDRALQPTVEPRIVVSTPIAESSLTVPGVRVVVDSGLARQPQRDARGVSGLVTLSCTRAAAEQRAGRAGREGPGVVYRCYSKSDFRSMKPHATPEIFAADLTQAALFLACWGSPDLPLIDAPPPAALHAARTTLQRLEAVDADGSVTATGRRLALMPVEPRLGRALLLTGTKRAAGIVACLADDPRGDVAMLRPEPRETERLYSLVDSKGNFADSPGVVTGLAYPDFIGRRVTEDEFLLANGTRARFRDGAFADAQWLAVASLSAAGKQVVIHAAAHIDEEDALAIIGTTDHLEASIEGGKIRGRKIRRAGKIVLSSTPVKVPAAQAEEALKKGLKLSDFTLNTAASILRERMAFIHAQVGEPWPDVSDEHLGSALGEWLAPEIANITAGAAISHVDMGAALRRLLPWPEAANFDALAPPTLLLPSGRNATISYDTGRPVISAKLQECFGLTQSPVFSGVTALFHLLSPAGRPLAITDDLASFWSGAYREVRAEMRGRYPKHPWPEDPWNAPATAKTKRS